MNKDDRAEYSIQNYPLTWLFMMLMFLSPFLALIIACHTKLSSSGILISSLGTYACFAVLTVSVNCLERFVFKSTAYLPFARKTLLYVMLFLLVVGLYFLLSSDLPLQSKGGAFILVGALVTPITILMRKKKH